MPVQYSNLEHTVETIVDSTPIFDMHTHLYPPAFQGLLLWGIDELLTYHYLIAEVLRVSPISPEEFYQMSKSQQADLIWDELFIHRSPISEACRGVVTTLEALNLDPSERDLNAIREWYSKQSIESFIDLVFSQSNLSGAVMTNDPFDATERHFWDTVGNEHPKLWAALRIDPLLLNWDQAVEEIRQQGYSVSSNLDQNTISEVKRFLEDWCKRINPRYMAVSLPPSFTYPDHSITTTLLDECILPFSRQFDLPFAMMIGVKRQINPALKLAGDSVGKADLSALENMCAKYPENRFLVTLLSRENQHEFCVIARKFGNLLPFGCWWFVNNPSIIEEMTRERLELLGWSFVPQHSDARVLDQLLYKWPHSRKVIARVLTDKYQDMVNAGWRVTRAEISRDVNRLFTQNFNEFAPPFS